MINNVVLVSSVVVAQLLSHVQLFATRWAAICQAPLSFTISWSLLKFMSTDSVILSISFSNPLFSFGLQSFPASGSFPVSQLCASGGQSIRASASASALLMKIFHLRQLDWPRGCSVSSITQLCPALCSPMDCSRPGFPVQNKLLELAQIHVHQVGDAIQPSHPLLSPSPPAFSPSQHQGLFQWVSSSHQVAKELELQLQHQSFQWIRTDLL